MKKIIRLTESDLHNIIKESAKRIIKEWDESAPDPSDYLDDEPLNRWYREHPDYDPSDETFDYENGYEDELIDDDESGWNERWK